jgi:ABC-type transport system substrate-binding protein
VIPRALSRALAGVVVIVAALTAQGADAPEGAAPPKVFRYAFLIAETGFDPAQISDLYSRTLAANIFEAPLGFEYLARPYKMKPLTAEALPEVSDDFKRFTFHLKRGIYFSDDPAFNGKKRELTAQDYVYSIKRHYDPRWKSPQLYLLENARLLGLSELRKEALATKQPFNYDREVEGIRALDRYTFEVRLAEPAPRFPQRIMTDSAAFGAVAREVVEAYGDRIMEHPVGTGAFVLAEWRRSSRIVMTRNPNYREEHYDEDPPADDARSQAIASQLKGRRLPMVDRVEVSIIEESQPRWLSFLNKQIDFMERLPNEFAPVVVPGNKLSADLRKRGITMDRAPLVDATIALIFNQDHPVVGGYTPDKVALRRAIALAYDANLEITQARKNQALPANGIIAPTVYGYEPAFKTEMSDHNPARAKALLDMYGYIDRDGDGWRDQPNGEPLVLEYSTQPDQLSRAQSELVHKGLNEVGLRVVDKVAKWPENLKASQAGKLMVWGLAWGAETPDGDTFLAMGYGGNKGGANHARFDLPAYNALYLKQNHLPDGPERMQAMDEANKLLVAYMPYKITSHRIATDLMHAWVIGYRRNAFVREFWKYIDIDAAAQQKALK